MKNKKIISILTLTLVVVLTFNSCKKPQEDAATTTPPPASTVCTPASSFTPGAGPNLVFKFKFDST